MPDIEELFLAVFKEHSRHGEWFRWDGNLNLWIDTDWNFRDRVPGTLDLEPVTPANYDELNQAFRDIQDALSGREPDWFPVVLYAARRRGTQPKEDYFLRVGQWFDPDTEDRVRELFKGVAVQDV